MSTEEQKPNRKRHLPLKLQVLLYIVLIGAAFYMGINFQKVESLKGISTGGSVRLGSQQTIKAPKLSSALEKKDFTLINVHSPYAGELPKTDLFVPYDEIVANETKLPADKNQKIVVYCESGDMSGQAVKTLMGMGYKNVSHLEGGMAAWKKEGYKLLDLSTIPDKVLPKEGFSLPISWNDMGPKLISLGVIDPEKFGSVIKMTDEQKKILTKGSDEKITINSTNSQFVVDMLWAYGLAQKSTAYTEGPMGKEYKSTVGNFASTGGWKLAKGDGVAHLGMHDMLSLTDEQHKRVEKLAKGVYRPCCGNHTWFPDCNHGMAALAAIELMVAADLSDDEIYKNVLKLNSFWFGSTYLANATYFARQGVDWESVNAQEVLGEKFSSSKGAGQIAKEVGELPFTRTQGGGCGA